VAGKESLAKKESWLLDLLWISDLGSFLVCGDATGKSSGYTCFGGAGSLFYGALYGRRSEKEKGGRKTQEPAASRNRLSKAQSEDATRSGEKI